MTCTTRSTNRSSSSAISAALTPLEFVTGILILPQRQTALVAKQAAEVDILSNGRLRLGVATSVGTRSNTKRSAPTSTRGALLEEQIEVMRRLWTEDSVNFEGRLPPHRPRGHLAATRSVPDPGLARRRHRAAVLDRIGRIADGWICNTQPGEGLEEALKQVETSAARAQRSGKIGLQGSVREERIRRRRSRLTEPQGGLWPVLRISA